MIRNLLLTLFVSLCTLSFAIAQVADTECPASEQNAYCDLDDVNGATFTNPDPAMSSPPSGPLCGGGVFNNPGWYSFVAGSTEIELTVTPLPMTCDTVDQGGMDLTGVQVALWQGCPDDGGSCVAGNSDCSDQPTTLNGTDLIVGEIYNIVIDGCGGSICTVQVSIDQSQPFDIPDVDDVEFADPEYNVRGGCESGLPDGVFCAGIEISFSIDDETYESLGAEWTWTFDGVGGSADASTIEWSSGSFSGTGTPAVVGDLSGELGANILNAIFDAPGTYEVCLIQVASDCETTNGEVCIEIDIITPGEQNFGIYEVCVLDLLAGWEVPEDDPDGNPWGGGEITLQDVESAPDGIIERTVEDDCGCSFTQVIQIIPVGSLDREEVFLQLLPCQLPYEWFELTIDNFEDYIDGVDEVLTEGSAQSDWEDINCDSLITLQVIPLQVIDSIIIGDCTPQGTEFTFVFSSEDMDGEEIDFDNFTFTWIDSTTNAEVGDGETVFLGTGTYYVSITGFVLDLNYSELAGNDTESLCEFVFGPYNLEGGSSSDPVVLPYDTTLCQEQLNQVVFVLDTVADTDYTWIVPPTIPFTINQNGDSLTVDWTNATVTDTVMVTASNGCGDSDALALPLDIVSPDLPTVSALGEECVSNEFMVSFAGNQADVQSYVWDFGMGMVTSGDETTAGPLGVTFPMSGTYTYFLTITDLGGCESVDMFEVTIEDPLEEPVVDCMGDPSQIIFSWNDVGADDYTINITNGPMTAVGTETGPTEFTVTGLNPNDQVTIEIISESSLACGNISTEQTCAASACNLTGLVTVFFEDLSFCQNHPDNQLVDFEHTLPMGITGSYSGPGITDAVNGIFDPNDGALALGENQITFTYMDANCAAMEMITVTINEIPVADFTPSSNSVCQGEVFTLQGFNNDPNAVWDYGQDAVGDFNGLSYPTSGMKEIKLVVIDPLTMCGDSITQMVEVRDTIIPPVITCTPGIDSVSFNWDDVTGVSSFDVGVSVEGVVQFSGNQVNSDYSQTGLMEGDMVEIMVTVTADNGCGDYIISEMCEAQTCYIPTIELSTSVNSFCTNENLSPVAIDVLVDGVVETGTFQGPGVMDQNLNQFDPTLAGVGMHTVTFFYTGLDNCVTTQTIDFEVLEVPVPSFALDNNTICVDDVLVVTSNPLPQGVNESWNYGTINATPVSPTETNVEYDGPGDYNITLNYTVAGCPPLEATETVTVVDTITFPTLRCEDSGTNFIEFGWNDQTLVDEYEIYIDGNLVGTQATTGYLLEDLEPETQHEITVVAIDNECGSRTVTLLCETPACTPPTITNNIPVQQCYEPGSGPIQLDVSVLSNTGTQGTYTWDTPLIDANDMFTPQAGDQVYNFNITYTEGNCITTEAVQFEINEVPANTLDQSVDQQVICVTSSIQITAEDASITDEFATWDFGDPALVTATGVGFGPYDLTFAQAGSYDISLTVDNNGCVSEERMVTIIVEDELIPPTLTCENEQVFSLDFTWDAVDCASDYIVFVDGVEVATVQTTSYSLDNLSENQSVDVQVEAVSECACTNVTSALASCSTTTCPSTTFDVSNFENNICLDETAASFNISATPVDLTGTGTGTWSGDPISSASGTVDPSLVTSGTYQLVYDYEESGCAYQYTTDITFVEAPDLNVIDEVDPQCEDDNFGSITVEGFGGQSGYMYAIDGGSMQASGQFDNVAPGAHVISIEDANGCINSTTVNIAPAPQVTASIDGPATVILDNDATYTLVTNAPNITNIIWTVEGNVECQGPNCTEFTVFGATQDANVTVEVIFNDNCSEIVEFFIDVKEIQSFYVPNIFSPSAVDAQNSTWRMYTKGSETFARSINIYNRWGNLVESNPNLTGESNGDGTTNYVLWDGDIGDSPAETEVYVYVLELEIEGINRIITGNVTIIR